MTAFFVSTESGWLRVNPWGIRRLLKWIKDRYGNPPVYVTENGVSDKGEMMDVSRATYYTRYINEVLKGMSNMIKKICKQWNILPSVFNSAPFNPHFLSAHLRLSEFRPVSIFVGMILSRWIEDGTKYIKGLGKMRIRQHPKKKNRGSRIVQYTVL